MPPKRPTEGPAKEITKTVPNLKNCSICHHPRRDGQNDLETVGGYWKLKEEYLEVERAWKI